MVMYEDDNEGNLILFYDYTPSATEVVKDIKEAPIEYGDTFQSKRKGKKSTLDKWICIDAELKDGAIKTIIEECLQLGFKLTKTNNRQKYVLVFDIPENEQSEQQTIMEK